MATFATNDNGTTSVRTDIVAAVLIRHSYATTGGGEQVVSYNVLVVLEDKADYVLYSSESSEAAAITVHDALVALL